MVRHFDEPFGDSSMIPTYWVSKLARKHVKVCLSGDGGDELFLGYNRYPSGLRILNLKIVDLLPQTVRRALFGSLSSLFPSGVKGKGRLRMYGMPDMERYGELIFAIPPHSQRSLLATHGEFDAPYDHLTDLWSATKGHPLPRRLQILDIHSYLPDDILTKVDRSSMRCSLEVRVPLLDHRIVELALSLPDEWRKSAPRIQPLPVRAPNSES